jgi:4-amino-4-deoxy-L-arabinose transferase-like glycosyltransferase
MKNLSESKMNRNLPILGGFIALSLIMRFFSFFPTLISHDEGTYFVIARELFQGKIYFADLVDTKPIGIFLVLGLFIKYCSASIFMIRMFTALIIALTSFTIYKISLHDQGEQKPAIAAGVVFIFLLSVFTQFGVFINPELFYTLFTALGFYIFITTNRPGGFLLLGFLLGIGFIFKYVVLFDLTAWLLYYFMAALLQKERKTKQIAFFHCVFACLGFIIPFSIMVVYYYHVGHLKELWYYTFGVTSRIPVERTLLKTLIYIGDFHLRFLPVLFFFYYALIKTRKGSSPTFIANGLIITWCLMVLLAVVLPGKPFGHYFIQLMLPVSIVAGRYFRESLIKPGWLNKIIRFPVGAIILVVIIAGNVAMQKHDYFDKPDIPRQVADYLRPKLRPQDRIYTGNYQQVLYYLLKKDCPVKYVHRTLMCSPDHRNALQIDLPKEMNALMGMDFSYILMKGPYCYEPMNVYLQENYQVIREFPGGVRVYEKR